MAKNKTFSGNRRAVGTPSLGKESMHQLIRACRDANGKTDRLEHMNARLRATPYVVKSSG